MIDLCLINPPHPYLSHPNAQASLALMSIAAAARDAGLSVQILNGSHLTAAETANEAPLATVYGVTATSVDVRQAEAVAAHLRRLHPEATWVLGGPAWLGMDWIDGAAWDAIVIGEGEPVIAQVVADAHAGRLSRIYEALPADLASLPAPARDLWPGLLGNGVFAGSRDYYPGGSTVIETSRGCPWSCAFCASAAIYRQRVRLRPVDAVVAEMEACVVDHGVRQFRFNDETLTASVERVEEFCRGIARSAILAPTGRPTVAWRASIRARPNEPAMFGAMRAGGCREVAIGVESADQDVLDLLAKGITVDDAREALRNARAAGLVTRALMMVGTPGETERTLGLNLAFWDSHPFDVLAVAVFAPFPGSAIRTDPAAYRCDLLDPDPTTYNVCQYGPDGRRRHRPFIRLWDMAPDRFAANVQAACDAAIAVPGINRG